MDERTTRRRPGRPAIGRDEPLTRDDILERARRLVQAEGLDALSMRRLAADLGVTPKALYNHAHDKAAVLDALVARVWADVLTGVRPDTDDPVEWLTQFNLRTRRIWLDNLELATLAMGVAEPNEWFILSSAGIAELMRDAGFPDVPLAYNAIQTYTMGSIAVAAARRQSSAYFGRDPERALIEARRLLDRDDATADHRGVIAARFEEGDNTHFEAGLRTLITALLGRHP
jgi:AcrR family transcriptional regulator